MIDFIECSTFCKGTPKLDCCKPFSSRLNDVGWLTFFLQGCKPIEVYWNPETNHLKVKGSLPYFLQGHNFSFSRSQFVEGIDLIQNLLDVPLWDSEVNQFEYGTIFPVPLKPSIYVRNHYSQNSKFLLQEDAKDKGGFRLWTGSGEDLKMYDAGKNFLKKVPKEYREGSGYSPEENWLKFEVRIKKPHLLNHSRQVTPEVLQSTSWTNYLNEFLLNQYKQLMTMKKLEAPTEKGQFTALDIAVTMYAEEALNAGHSLQDAKKAVYQTINQADCLSKTDKDSRKSTIRKAFSKLKEEAESRFDVTEMIKQSLRQEGH